jgi:hypothetical protein
MLKAEEAAEDGVARDIASSFAPITTPRHNAMQAHLVHDPSAVG